ncbi:MAG TPA: hypothetical protein VMR62_01965 [Bryobacteraceae bacterium]|jgi:hypothetical protein|nr:hypothetical protein [Bryobacteraceae bacterium]
MPIALPAIVLDAITFAGGGPDEEIRKDIVAAYQRSLDARLRTKWHVVRNSDL